MIVEMAVCKTVKHQCEARELNSSVTLLDDEKPPNKAQTSNVRLLQRIQELLFLARQ
jgi:hypothetical protein